jgi:hypothetical protein
MSLLGLMEIPPVSKVTPLPGKTNEMTLKNVLKYLEMS